MSGVNQPVQHKWTTDRPLERLEDDALGRASFAKRVAKEISAWRAKKDSLVISLNGDWGTGKTSLKSFILKSIISECETNDLSPPAIVEFNPWQWSGQNLILEAFFDEIGTVFRGGKVKNRLTAARLARFWEGLKAVTVATREVATQMRESLVAATALVAGGSGVAATMTTSPGAKEFWRWMGLAFIALAALCGAVPPVADALAAAFKWKSEKKKPSLDQVRSDLRAELENLEAPVLVVIDDIDRLTKREVRLLMQLVKANANFPNVVFLLLYQKDIVSQALDKVTSEGGSNFLKKIVQIELEVPAAPEHRLRGLFTQGIDRIWSRGEFRWDTRKRERFRQLFEDAVWPYFATPRDVKRFLSVYEFYYEGHLNEGVLEVNPIDLLLVETLRMFDFQAYDEIAGAFQKQRNVFMELLFEIKEAQDKFVAGFTDLIEKRDLDTREKNRLRSLVYGLFPQASEKARSNQSEWDRDLRVCHPTHFSKYFQLVPDPGDVPAALIAKLAAVRGDQSKARGLVEESIRDGCFIALLERLRTIKDDLPEASIEAICLALFDVSETLPEMKPQMPFPGDVEREVGRVVGYLIERIQDATNREKTLLSIVQATSAVAAPVFCISILEPSEERAAGQRQEIIRPATIAAAKSELLPRMWTIAKSGRLWSSRLAALIVYRLRDWDSSAAVTQWLNEAIKDPKVAISFLVEMLQVSNVNGGWHSDGRTTFSLLGQRMNEMVDINLLLNSAEKAMTTDLEEMAVKGLKRAIKLKSENKPFAELYLMSRIADGSFVQDRNDARF